MLSRPPAVFGTTLVLLLALGIEAAPPASAATPLVDRLIPTAMAHKLGFPTVANKATFSHNTGTSLCGSGAEVVYQNKPAVTGLVDEIFSCHSPKAALQLLQSTEAKNPASSAVSVPKTLGSSGFFTTHAPLYAFYWTHGSYLAFVAVDTAATSNVNKQRALKLAPLTPKWQSALSQAAVEQAALLK